MGICERCGRPHDDGVDVEYDLPVNVDRALSAFGADGFCPSCLAAFIGEWAAYPPQMLCLGHITPPADKDVRQIGGRDGWWRVWAGDNSVGWKSAICRAPARGHHLMPPAADPQCGSPVRKNAQGLHRRRHHRQRRPWPPQAPGRAVTAPRIAPRRYFAAGFPADDVYIYAHQCPRS